MDDNSLFFREPNSKYEYSSPLFSLNTNTIKEVQNLFFLRLRRVQERNIAFIYWCLKNISELSLDYHLAAIALHQSSFLQLDILNCNVTCNVNKKVKKGHFFEPPFISPLSCNKQKRLYVKKHQLSQN